MTLLWWCTLDNLFMYETYPNLDFQKCDIKVLEYQ